MTRRLTDGATVRFVRDYNGPGAGFVVPAGTLGHVRAVNPDNGRAVVAVPIEETHRSPNGRRWFVAVTVERRQVRVTAPPPDSPFVTFQPRGARS